MGEHQRFLLAEQLRHLDSLDQRIDRVSAEIAERVRPFEALIGRLDAIPGIGRRVAEVLVAEVGTDMTRFPSAAHLASWAGLCPGNNESAGKRKSGRIRRGNPWVRMALVETAHAAVRAKDSYLSAQFRRLAGAKQFHHPLVGDLTLAFESLEPPADPGLWLLTYSAEHGSASERALDELARWGATRTRLSAIQAET
jgi:hypothetical protein